MLDPSSEGSITYYRTSLQKAARDLNRSLCAGILPRKAFEVCPLRTE